MHPHVVREAHRARVAPLARGRHRARAHGAARRRRRARAVRGDVRCVPRARARERRGSPTRTVRETLDPWRSAPLCSQQRARGGCLYIAARAIL